MPPSLKDTETAVTTTTTSAPASPAPKPPADATRPQPVALEIPVTINGAHTVAGSDKREPFSETTQTVLVFAHGAVVRVTTSLAPGQLVFLTNEKTKKEVVCQVLKSKSGGSTNNNYVELQFTEPAPSFWGLRTPAGPAAPPPAAPPAPRPVSSAAPPAPAPSKPATPVAPPPPPRPIAATPKPVAPPSPLVSVPPPSPLPAATTAPPVQAAPPAPPKPTVAPPLPSAATPVTTPPVAPLSTAPLVSAAPPSPLSVAPEPPPVQSVPPTPPLPQSLPASQPPVASVAPPAPQTPSAPENHPSGIPVPPLHDYSKEIEALFSTPSSTSRPAPAAPPEPKVVPPPASSAPSTEQLKLEAARLQAQLSSMLFTETPSPSHAAPPPPPPNPEVPASDIAKKVFEIAAEPPKPPAPETKLPEPKLVPPPPRKAVSLTAEDEEVKIPSWLAPLSHHSDSAATEAPAPQLAASEPEMLEESAPAESAEPSHSVETPMFGGQLLLDSPSEPDAPPVTSKKALWIGVAAAALFVVGSVAFFLRPMLSGSAPTVSAKSTSVPPASSSTPAAPPVVETKSVAPSASNVTSAPAASTPSPSQPPRNPEPVSNPAPSSPAAEVKASNPAPRNAAAPAPEPPKKSALGDVHLAAPVVSRESNGEPSSEPLPAIDTTSNSNSGADALAAESSHRAQPTAPLPVGGDVKPAQLTKSVPPVYPPVAKAQHITGNVTIDCLIDANGDVSDLKVVSGPPLLHRAATDAVKQWKYKPAILDGQPTSMRVTVTVQFRAQ